MKIRINAVGRAKQTPLSTIFNDYISRLPWKVTLKEIETHGRLVAQEQQRKECSALIKDVPDKGFTIALDSRGERLSSEEFAMYISGKQDDGVPDLFFLIGGSEGIDNHLLTRANKILSFGDMTWPHMMVRIMLAEQLYRASTIISGHPYHRVSHKRNICWQHFA